jgi:hypothetical protein
MSFKTLNATVLQRAGVLQAITGINPASQFETGTVSGGATVDRSTSETYSSTASYQSYPADLTLGAAAGKASGSTSFLAPFMGNVMNSATLTKDGENTIGGVIGAFGVTGAVASTGATGAVVGVVSDGVSDVDGAIVAVLGGDDGGTTTPHAMFAVRRLNSTVGNKAEYGLDLYDSTAGYTPMLYSKADVRLSNNVVMLNGAGAPVDYSAGPPIVGTGIGFAGIGSIYVDTTNGKLYVNGGTLAQPVWKIVTSA